MSLHTLQSYMYNAKIKASSRCVNNNLSLYTLLLPHLTCSWCWERSCSRWLFCCCWSRCISEVCSSTSLSCRALSSCCCSSCSPFSSHSKLCSSWAFSPCRRSHCWTLSTWETENSLLWSCLTFRKCLCWWYMLNVDNLQPCSFQPWYLFYWTN